MAYALNGDSSDIKLYNVCKNVLCGTLYLAMSIDTRKDT